MSIKVEMEWFTTKEKLHPDKHGVDAYEQIPCQIIRIDRNYAENAQWNCEHECWDREDGDDHLCDTDQVKAWAIIPLVPYDQIERGGA